MISYTNGRGGMRGLLASIAGDGGWDDGGIRNTESKAGHPGIEQKQRNGNLALGGGAHGPLRNHRKNHGKW